MGEFLGRDYLFNYFINVQTHELSIVILVYVSMINISNAVNYYKLLSLSLKVDISGEFIWYIGVNNLIPCGKKE